MATLYCHEVRSREYQALLLGEETDEGNKMPWSVKQLLRSTIELGTFEQKLGLIAMVQCTHKLFS
jgi:hypothetical protein